MSKLSDHIDCLHEKVFFTATKWPQYKLLLQDLQQLNHLLNEGDTVISFERNKMYGGFSPFGPLFPARSYLVDEFTYREETIIHIEINDKRFIRHDYDYNNEEETASLVIVPNLLHHIKDVDLIFEEWQGQSSRYIYIFEPLNREIHQAPYHYVQYTPYGLRDRLEREGFKVVWEHETGGPFTQAAYVHHQAEQYLFEEDRSSEEEWRQIIAEAEEMDKMYPKNLVRDNTRFPTAFSILVEKV